MKIGRLIALQIGILTALPLVYMVLFFATFFAAAGPGRTAHAMPIFGSFERMMVLHLGTMVLTVALLVFYIVHAFKNERLSGEKRILWVLVLFFGTFIAELIYWWIYVWGPPAEGPRPGEDPSGVAG